MSPLKKEVAQQLSFYLSVEIPREEFKVNSEIYKFKNPSNFESYIPSGNLFEDESLSVTTYFHEDTMTFCSALLDTTFNNSFKITKASYHIDNNGKEAIDVEGMFATRYNPICNNGNIALEDGTFRVKLLLSEIP